MIDTCGINNIYINLCNDYHLDRTTLVVEGDSALVLNKITHKCDRVEMMTTASNFIILSKQFQNSIGANGRGPYIATDKWIVRLSRGGSHFSPENKEYVNTVFFRKASVLLKDYEVSKNPADEAIVRLLKAHIEAQEQTEE